MLPKSSMARRKSGPLLFTRSQTSFATPMASLRSAAGTPARKAPTMNSTIDPFDIISQHGPQVKQRFAKAVDRLMRNYRSDVFTPCDEAAVNLLLDLDHDMKRKYSIAGRSDVKTRKRREDLEQKLQTLELLMAESRQAPAAATASTASIPEPSHSNAPVNQNVLMDICRTTAKTHALLKFQRMQQDSDRLARIEEKMNNRAQESVKSLPEQQALELKMMSLRIKHLEEASANNYENQAARLPSTSQQNLSASGHGHPQIDQLAQRADELSVGHTKLDQRFRTLTRRVEDLWSTPAIIQDTVECSWDDVRCQHVECGYVAPMPASVRGWDNKVGRGEGSVWGSKKKPAQDSWCSSKESSHGGWGRMPSYLYDPKPRAQYGRSVPSAGWPNEEPCASGESGSVWISDHGWEPLPNTPRRDTWGGSYRFPAASPQPSNSYQASNAPGEDSMVDCYFNWTGRCRHVECGYDGLNPAFCEGPWTSLPSEVKLEDTVECEGSIAGIHLLCRHEGCGYPEKALRPSRFDTGLPDLSVSDGAKSNHTWSSPVPDQLTTPWTIRSRAGGFGSEPDLGMSVHGGIINGSNRSNDGEENDDGNGWVNNDYDMEGDNSDGDENSHRSSVAPYTPSPPQIVRGAAFPSTDPFQTSSIRLGSSSTDSGAPLRKVRRTRADHSSRKLSNSNADGTLPYLSNPVVPLPAKKGQSVSKKSAGNFDLSQSGPATAKQMDTDNHSDQDDHEIAHIEERVEIKRMKEQVTLLQEEIANRQSKREAALKALITTAGPVKTVLAPLPMKELDSAAQAYRAHNKALVSPKSPASSTTSNPDKKKTTAATSATVEYECRNDECDESGHFTVICPKAPKVAPEPLKESLKYSKPVCKFIFKDTLNLRKQNGALRNIVKTAVTEDNKTAGRDTTSQLPKLLARHISIQQGTVLPSTKGVTSDTTAAGWTTIDRARDPRLAEHRQRESRYARAPTPPSPQWIQSARYPLRRKWEAATLREDEQEERGWDDDFVGAGW